MKLHKKVIIEIESGEVIADDVIEYGGPVAECKGGEAAKPYESTAGKIVGGKKIRGPLETALLGNIIKNPFTDYDSQQYKQAVADISGGYGARGLEGSGIAIKGEQNALQKIVSQTEAQRAGQLNQLLGTASGAPNLSAPTQGSGFMGMK